MEYLCVALPFSGLIGAIIGTSNGRSAEGFLWGILLGPIGWIIVAVSPKAYGRKCPYCLAGIPREAVKCRHCGSNLRERRRERTRNDYRPSSDNPFNFDD
jgi:ribosomal protein L40E